MSLGPVCLMAALGGAEDRTSKSVLISIEWQLGSELKMAGSEHFVPTPIGSHSFSIYLLKAYYTQGILPSPRGAVVVYGR